MHSDMEKKLTEIRTKFLGLEETSSVKSYYPQLKEKILELEKNESFLKDKSKALLNILEDLEACLLYTSDAADERSSVDLGGRRIIKKKTNTKKKNNKKMKKKT